MASPADPSASSQTEGHGQQAADQPRQDETFDTCRICRGEATADGPLFYPCKCSGSIKYVHQDCLMEWLAHSQKKYCELCKTPFHFTKLYDQSMPETVPWVLFLRQAAIHTVKAIGRWTRYAIVLFIWLCWLPWTIRQIWRALFWLADGSWLTTQEMQAAVEAYANHMGNASSSANATTMSVLNATTVDHAGLTGIGFFSTLLTVLGLLNPQILLQAVIRAFMHLVVTPKIHGEPVKWERAFLFAPFPRPPSLLSDWDLVASATKLPILNNALIDILEGQLVCLAIVTTFIVVFLIREWVINQQPLLNLPDDEQVENPAPVPPANDQHQPARHRRRALPRLGDHERQVGEDQDQPAQRPRANLRARRHATENNILVQDNHINPDRPALPPRAASLVPALQELEENMRLLSDGHVSDSWHATDPPPLERGAFDEIGQIQRTLAEASSSSAAQFFSLNSANASEVQGELPVAQALDATASVGNSELASPPTFAQASSFSQNEFTFRAPQSPLNNSFVDVPATNDPLESNRIWQSGSDSPSEVIPTLLDPSTRLSMEDTAQLGSDHPVPQINSAHDLNADVSESDSDEIQSEGDDLLEADNEPDDVLSRLVRWLWHTDDYVPGPVPDYDDNETEIVADIDAQAPFVPVRHDVGGMPQEQQPRPQPEPNIQDGANINDPNAVDEAEDLEGVLELIGMEGPIAGMVQNIIFSVFLITLTLSASVWCPYIWGKIALLVLAHPFSVFFKAPLFLLSRLADFLIDICLFVTGLSGVALTYLTTPIRSLITLVSPRAGKMLENRLLETFSLSLSQNSGSRLEQMISRTVMGFRPDLPTFSIQSHHVLRVFARATREIGANVLSICASYMSEGRESIAWNKIFLIPVRVGNFAKQLPTSGISTLNDLQIWATQLKADLRPLSLADPEKIDYTLVQWTVKEKIACILLGYILFATAGAIYLRLARWYDGLKPEDKVQGFVAETLAQAGGVMKVVLIIGIEMIIFPLYCGTMLDIALLPVFEGATLGSRMAFFATTPLTALFIHWFVGTCYMFHFALFVSMCRKIMRKGVLYFIRDPDDPSFHPVRDVLERPVATQLGKIAFSAFVYGSLLVICLGGVVNGLSRIDRVLPLRWGALEPQMVISGDIIFYNFMLPVIIRKIDVPAKVTAMFLWWFKACAGALRLSDFLFGHDCEEEKQAGPFLWQRFFKLLLQGEVLPKHPMIKYVEDLTNDRERLVWFQSEEGDADDETVRKVFPGTQFRLINLLGDKSQALVHFDAGTSIDSIKAALDAASSMTDARFSVRKVKDMKVENIDMPNSRKTVVDDSAGSYVRAPAKDSTRIPKGTSVFVKVNEKNERLDGREDSLTGLHGKYDERFSRIFVPNHFRARITTFIGLVWLFAALSGLAFTVCPLILGRALVRCILPSGGPVSDLYAITAGAHALAGIAYLVPKVKAGWVHGIGRTSVLVQNAREVLPRAARFIKYALGILYLSIALGFVVPMALSIIAELYINIPAYMYLVSRSADGNAETPSNPLISSTQGSRTPPVVHLLQTWALGLLYLRAVIRVVTNTPRTNTRPAAAIRAITRNGLLNPDVRLASRALVLPILAATFFLVGLPPGLTRVALFAFPRDLSSNETVRLYSFSYPCVLLVALMTFALMKLQARIETWRVRIRDEVYLIGERLHNFHGADEYGKGNVAKRRRSKGKGRASVPSMSAEQDAVLTTAEASHEPVVRSSEAGPTVTGEAVT